MWRIILAILFSHLWRLKKSLSGWLHFPNFFHFVNFASKKQKSNRIESKRAVVDGSQSRLGSRDWGASKQSQARKRPRAGFFRCNDCCQAFIAAAAVPTPVRPFLGFAFTATHVNGRRFHCRKSCSHCHVPLPPPPPCLQWSASPLFTSLQDLCLFCASSGPALIALLHLLLLLFPLQGFYSLGFDCRVLLPPSTQASESFASARENLTPMLGSW